MAMDVVDYEIRGAEMQFGAGSKLRYP